MNLAYIAGIIDGEGCIGFTRCRTNVYPRVIVTNTNLELLEELKKQFGGDISSNSKGKTGWKKGYNWDIRWSKAIDLLDRVYEYLFIKYQQANVVFAWDAIRPGSGKKWDTEARNLLVDEMHWLNQKGDIIRQEPILAEIAIGINAAKRKKK